MSDVPNPSTPDRAQRHSLVATAVVLAGLLALHLLPALYGALAAFALHRALSGPMPPGAGLGRRWGPALLTGALLVAILLGGGKAAELLLGSRPGGLAQLLGLMADALDRIRSSVPPWLAERLPDSTAGLQHALAAWLRGHAGRLQHWGHEALRIVVQLLLGVAIGLLAGTAARSHAADTPVPRLLLARWLALADAFADVFAAQVRIALVNAALTGLYLLVALPLLDLRVPLSATLVAFTFVAGLVPIVGNLLSNSAVVLASLMVEPWLAGVSLGFLVLVHKLEYFLNAHFVGHRIRLPTYALLSAMLIGEAAFGVAGLVAAPVVAAWLTRELRAAGWL
ncbi:MULTISPECIES: AI-2E family transporter [Ramlibacter]|uniref:AI-2E family transporter n=1 Tax=Ramlibacter aquaticus TaxID=2780094 RepID=A0ABR9SHK0_9BURK|nr:MULTISPECIES: AI-2E family transporter [Ramlibacter]MBE7941835.1 AI-2E family transporter [Ramlibacter aquaticus]